MGELMNTVKAVHGARKIFLIIVSVLSVVFFLSALSFFFRIGFGAPVIIRLIAAFGLAATIPHSIQASKGLEIPNSPRAKLFQIGLLFGGCAAAFLILGWLRVL